MSGYNTAKKKLVADFFAKNRGKEFGVAEAARELDGKVGFSSVYRIVARLEAEGTLRKFYREGEKQMVYRYFDCQACKAHLHMKCTECGKVYHLSSENTEAIGKILGKGFLLQNEQTTLFGLCKACNIDEVKK